MLLNLLLIIPLLGIFSITSIYQNSPSKIENIDILSIMLDKKTLKDENQNKNTSLESEYKYDNEEFKFKKLALIFSILNLLISLIIYILFDFNSNEFQYIQEEWNISVYNIYLGIDGISIYFVLLTTIITPIGIISNWHSIKNNAKYYLIIMLLLETLLLSVFLVLDILLFYIFFESILPPLFILIGLYGSTNKVRASFYIFLYTLLGSLFLLLSILTISAIIGTTYLDVIFKTNLDYPTQFFLFCGIFIAFAVKTPTIFLNS